MICGVVGYGYFISSAATYFVDGDFSWKQYRKKIIVLNRYLKVFFTIKVCVMETIAY